MTDERPLVAGVAGWPIAHSRSPLLFDHWFRSLSIPGRYVPLAVRPQDFDEVYRALPRAGFRGINVTIPHKLEALARADEASVAARSIGAANMIVFDPIRGIVADNTDAYGFIQNLREACPGWRPQAGEALVLGAGGAARAVVFGLLTEGVPGVRLANRSLERAQELAVQFGPRVRAVRWEDRDAAVDGAATIVNATSLGMSGGAQLDVSLHAAAPGTLVTDLVYTPLDTPLLAAARRRGLSAVDGLGMLLHQARPAFHAWFGIDPPVDKALRAAVLDGRS